MDKQWFRVMVVTAGAAMTVAVAGCGSGDSTVSAPSSDVATTSSATSSSSSAASSSAPSSSASASATESGTDSGPRVETSAPAGFPGGATPAPQGSKGAAYLAELKRVGVTFPNDPDNSVAFATAEYVCSARANNTGADQIKTYVTAFVASGTVDAAAASANADKVIAAASTTYCK